MINLLSVLLFPHDESQGGSIEPRAAVVLLSWLQGKGGYVPLRVTDRVRTIEGHKHEHFPDTRNMYLLAVCLCLLARVLPT